MKQIITLLVLVLTLNSCDLNDDCGECFTPPPEFNFKFVDKVTGEDLIYNGTVSLDNIEIKDEEDKIIDFEKHLINDEFIISVYSIGWELDAKTYTIYLSDTINVVFDLDMDTVSEDCCTFFEVKNFDVLDYEYEVDNYRGVIVVKI
ncbi:hypothetical protein [uncultured Lutibacter sp.]|uniref:hypothetical protein n=1 Tax=uncultured Lutibacter sp. TaxID=437739 RepID=UPI00261691FF|nr:hypothetical protein [uncultured Lutibacter sp.]